MIRKVILLLAVVAIIGPASDAEACRRCGLFGNRCRYYVAPVKYYAPAAVVKQADVFVVQNNYPQPIAQQGSSVYGLSVASAAYAVNPSELFRQAASLSQAATATASLGISGFNTMASTQLQLQAAITEPLARGHAAAQVLSAAGFTSPAQQTQSLALRITQDSAGRWQVLQADPVEVNEQINDRVPPPPLPNGTTSILTTHCGKCHGLSLAEPKGQRYIDPQHTLTNDEAWTALQMVWLGKMPPESEPTLTNDDKGRILDELMKLSKPPTTE